MGGVVKSIQNLFNPPSPPKPEAPPPPPPVEETDPAAAERAKRLEEQARRRRGLAGLIATSPRGVLQASTQPLRKTLLGE